jgi:S-adenosylmethionine hydrolase
MAIVTLLSDSGESDHYVAAIKARVLSTNPGLTLVDISHQIKACDIAHGAFVLKSVFRDFPKGTVHLVAVDAAGGRDDAFIAMQLEDHYFVSVDNGILGLISDKPQQNVVELNSLTSITTSFPEKDILAPAAAKLASGVSITTLGKPLLEYRKMTDRRVKATKKQMFSR